MEKAKVFEKTYMNYLDQLAKVDLGERADILGVKPVLNGLEIPFFNTTYIVGQKNIRSREGDTPTFAIRVVLCKYILMAPSKVKNGNDQLVTYREFRDAGPLISYFTNNTNKIIETSFSGNLQDLREKCRLSGGIERKSEGYDLSVRFISLPRIPIILNFNDKDDLFSAKASILYRSDAEIYLDMECLAITGTYLTGMLLKNDQNLG